MSQLKQLYKLIHSLSKGEKKQFTQQVQKHQFKQDKYFYTLYKILESETNFQEELIINCFKKETKKSDLTDDKNYLQDQLLNAISINSTENNVELYILQLLLKIRSLENKGQYELALKYIKQAIKLCEETENFVLLLRCLNIEQSFYPYLHENTDNTILAQQKYDETLAVLVRMNQLDKMVLAISKIYERDNKSGNTENLNEITSLLQQLPAIETLQFNREKSNYHQINFAVFYKNKDYIKSYFHLATSLELMQKNYYFIYEDKWMYLTSQINAAHNAFKNEDSAKIELHFNQIDILINHSLFNKNDSFIIEAKKLKYTHQLIIYLFQKNYNKILSLEKVVVAIFSQAETSTYFTKPRNMNVCFAIANTALGNYAKAYEWALEEVKIPNSRDYEIYTLICYYIKLIYFIENEMIANFDSEYLSATRYIRGKKNFEVTDKKLLKLLDTIKIKNNNSTNKLYIQKNSSLFSNIMDNYLYHFIFEYLGKKN